MKKIFFLLLIIPILGFSQFDKTIKLKVAMMQNCFKKDSVGETTFWQTKGKVTFNIVKYTPEQNPVFKELFIKQYQELLPIYKKMVVSEDERDTALFIKTLIRQEDDFRNLLKPEQLKAYSEKLLDFEKNNLQSYESYSSLFFSDNLLNEFKFRFGYNSEIEKSKTVLGIKKSKKSNKKTRNVKK
jgi:hypothetical protein